MSDGNVSADVLLQFIERAETVITEKQNAADDLKDVFAEAKSQGFDTKTMRSCIKLRAMERAARQEQEMLLDTYKSALKLD